MINYVTYIKDTIGNNYLGIKFDKGTVEPFLNQLKDIIGEKDFENFTNNQQTRDKGSYHLTVINVMDYNKLSKELGMDKFVSSLDSIFKYEVDDLKLMGVGTAERNTNRAYFIVCQSDKLDAIRDRYGLGEHDFHITLGFNHKDVFGVRKNEVLPEIDPFLKLLKQEYYNHNETFEFIRSIQNFDGDKSKDIEPIEIKDTNITFRCGDLDYYTMGLIDNNFRILAHWQDNNKKPILPNTMISKKFNQI
jgi:hypothetical protein